jgi:PAS domain S-box-containing protein
MWIGMHYFACLALFSPGYFKCDRFVCRLHLFVGRFVFYYFDGVSHLLTFAMQYRTAMTNMLYLVFKYFALCMAIVQVNREMHKYKRNDTRTMDGYEQEIEQIKQILRENPKGMTVTDVARKIKINRNSVAKYLDIMRISGHVEMITFGPAKVFFPSRRIPIHDMLNYTSDFILVFDADLKITMINDSFLNFLNYTRENILGQIIHELLTEILEDTTEILIGIKESLEGKKFKQELNIKMQGDTYFFMLKIVPTTFDDGRIGGTCIIKNDTDNKIAENALRESEQNFKNLLKKINKK